MSAAELAQGPHTPDPDSPQSNASGSADGSADDLPPADQAATAKRPDPAPAARSDKPRPHICLNCGRGFARLEHLKRHERSHTKEKPFECPECSRCFARRDLLLRHQQKLHFAPGNPRGGRGGRRESAGAAPTTSARVRKNSIAGAPNPAVGYGGPRPRANTVGHLDLSSLAQLHRSDLTNVGQNLQLPGPIDFHGMPTANGNHGLIHNLPKLDTQSLHAATVEDGLRTAPAYPGAGSFDHNWSPVITSSTVNPAQLHFNGSMDSPHSPFHPSHLNLFDQNAMTTNPQDDFSWVWDHSLMLDNHEFAIDESSPSAMDASTGNLITPMDASTGNLVPPMDMQSYHVPVSEFDWSNANMGVNHVATPSPFQMDVMSSGLAALDQSVTMSPQQMTDPSYQDAMFNVNMQIDTTPFSMPSTTLSNFDADSPGMASSITGSARQSSVTSVSTSSITDATRQALVMSLSQPAALGNSHRTYSQPTTSSPLSPSPTSRSPPALPATSDLQRFVNAYIQHFHPHLPFLHIPTLSFDSMDYISSLRSTTPSTSGSSGIVGGGGCLVLAMASIGALYEYDHAASRDLFESAKKMIQLYLEERRKLDVTAAVHPDSAGTPSNTPLWIVQAMLLTVIYGHHCGDKHSADVASTHCAALVSLARAAELGQPSAVPAFVKDEGASPHSDSIHSDPNFRAWLAWRDAEERKRTFFAVFTLSTLLVIAYNHAPAVMNSEILLDLPCDEGLWSAENSAGWIAAGGARRADQDAVPFSQALSTLLTASQRTGALKQGWYSQQNNPDSNFAYQWSQTANVRPSTFGCLVLINALHNFIWETRSRHHNSQWTTQETEAMFTHIQPALNAWQAAWKSNDQHHLQRPNPFGQGPLSADSIPLLDLAFVRLFVNLGTSKEAFWQRDYDTMADEFARGSELSPRGDSSTNGNGQGASPNGSDDASPRPKQGLRRPSLVLVNGHGSKRERNLRRAAFYAADSLIVATKFSLTYVDVAAHELPIQAAMCFFDCSQVLAEWLATVQERVGKYLGIIGSETIDYNQVPAIMLIESEDNDLITKIENVCALMEQKLSNHIQMLGYDFVPLSGSVGLSPMQAELEKLRALQGLSLSCRIMKVTAMMLGKSAVWPVTQVMANALDVQVEHMNQRAKASVANRQTA